MSSSKYKPTTKSQLIAAMAEEGEVPKRVAAAMFEKLTGVIHQDLKKAGKAVVPGVAVLTVKRTPAKPAREGRNPATGEPLRIAAKPAGKTVRARVPKTLKESV